MQFCKGAWICRLPTKMQLSRHKDRTKWPPFWGLFAHITYNRGRFGIWNCNMGVWKGGSLCFCVIIHACIVLKTMHFHKQIRLSFNLLLQFIHQALICNVASKLSIYVCLHFRKSDCMRVINLKAHKQEKILHAEVKPRDCKCFLALSAWKWIIQAVTSVEM